MNNITFLPSAILQSEQQPTKTYWGLKFCPGALANVRDCNGRHQHKRPRSIKRVWRVILRHSAAAQLNRSQNGIWGYKQTTTTNVCSTLLCKMNGKSRCMMTSVKTFRKHTMNGLISKPCRLVFFWTEMSPIITRFIHLFLVKHNMIKLKSVCSGVLWSWMAVQKYIY